jgi:hypothetical protein
LGRLPTVCIAVMMILPHGRAGSGAKKLKAANHAKQRLQKESERALQKPSAPKARRWL